MNSTPSGVLVDMRVNPVVGVPLPELLGRGREREVLDRLVQEALAGRSGALVLRGEPGIGKTALLDYLCGGAFGCCVARAAGVESEVELAYAGLHQLCAPFLDRLPLLPGPQADALRSAFGLQAGDAPDRFLVGLAVLTLLSEAAEIQPLVCAVDDAQWLDQASKQALAFAARRLAAESVVLVFAVRETGDDQDLAALPGLTVRGLDPEASRALLQRARPGPMDEQVRDRLLGETRGNPLALLELNRVRSAEGFAGGFGLAQLTGGVASIEQSFSRQLAALPAETRALLLVAAAEPLGDPLVLWRAARRLGIGPGAADAAEAEGLLSIGERVIFRHPLVRSVTYGSAAEPDRRAAHLALAQVTDSGTEPARRAWHLAAAAAGPDEEVAAELERCASLAQQRGGLAAASSFLQRAVTLTTDPARLADRALAAAEASLGAGAFDTVLGLLGIAEAGELDDMQCARVTMLRAQARHARKRGSEGPLLVQAAEALEPFDPELARDTYLDSWYAALFAGATTRGVSLAEISRRALAARRREGPPQAGDLLLEGFSCYITEGRAAATPLLQRAAATFSGGAATAKETLRWGVQAGSAAVTVWDYQAAVTTVTRQLNAARESGSLTSLAVALNALTQTYCLSGNLRDAGLAAAESSVVAKVTGARLGTYGEVMLAGYRGREVEARKLIADSISEATAAGQGRAVQCAWLATAMLCNGLGHYDQALAAAKQAMDGTPELFVADWVTIELVEAAARAGHPEMARTALERLAEGTAAAGTDWALGVEARLRALLTDDDAADRLYREAIERLSRTQLAPQLARAHLVYGEWLRRGGRGAEARHQLRSAHDMFAAMTMEAFAERARQELAATGERVRERSVDALDKLTVQEAQIGQLAAAGRTNPEIGAQLFLSPRTIEWHLRKVFTKLGVTSRRELAIMLREPARASALAVHRDAHGQGR